MYSAVSSTIYLFKIELPTIAGGFMRNEVKSDYLKLRGTNIEKLKQHLEREQIIQKVI